MRVIFTTVLIALFISSNSGEPYKKYDASAIRRFDDELRRLGVVLTSFTKLDDPVDLPEPIVSSSTGDFEGYWTSTQFGRPIAAFEGIPYAQPPVGPLRFKVAQPLTQHLGDFKAQKPSPMCMQRNLYIGSTVIEGNEDCLYINVYTPEKLKRSESELLPVMFWIHGGGFLSGEGSLYRPNLLLDRDVVLVTFNYRLGPLGFLTTEDGVIPGNLGLRDQVQALRWVRDNIGAFGGNPNLITVFGQSAGGASTEFHMLSPLSKGLFHRAISISGSAMAPWALAPPGEPARHRNRAAEFWKCPKESAQLLECLKSKSAEEITGVDYAFIKWGISPMMPFKPVVEDELPNAFLPSHPVKRFKDGFNDVPWMLGMTSEEGGIGAIAIVNNETQLNELNENFNELLPLTLLMNDRVSEKQRITFAESLRRAYFAPGKIYKRDVSNLVNVYTDFFMLWPMIQDGQLHRIHSKSPLYTWLFSYQGERSFSSLFGDRVNPYGACHGDDLIYLFDIPALFGDAKPSPEDVWMSIFLTEVYTNFARDGVPSSKLVETQWKPTTAQDIEYLHIAAPRKVSMESNLYPERWRFMEKASKVIGEQYKDEL